MVTDIIINIMKIVIIMITMMIWSEEFRPRAPAPRYLLGAQINTN